MDTLLTNIQVLLSIHVIGSIKILHLLNISIGILLPIIFGLILPRRKTVQYGMLINKTLGLALLQKRIFRGMSIPEDIIGAIVTNVQTTFQDVSFGVYIDSRKDITPEEKQKKIDEYLTVVPVVITIPVPVTPAPTTPPEQPK